MYRSVMRPLLLDLHHYETVVAIVELGTMTEAATHLSTTQSALSHRLAEAERRLGTKLFERGRNRRLSPTREGLALHQAASRALADLARAETTLVASPPSTRTTLRVAVGSYDCYHWFPDFLGHIHAALDDVDLELVVVGDTPGAALASNEVDIVLAPGTPEGDLELTPIFDDELVFVTASGHRLADADSVHPEDFAEETYLTYNSSPTPGFEYDRFIRPSDVYPLVVRVVRQTSAICELVAAGAGVSILSRWAMTPLLATGRVRAITCGDGLALRWHAATRRKDDQSLRVVEELGSHLSR